MNEELIVSHFSIAIVDLVDESDISAPKAPPAPVKKEESPTPVSSASLTGSKQPLGSPAIQNDVDMDGLSARERNKLKRRAKTDLKFKGKDK